MAAADATGLVPPNSSSPPLISMSYDRMGRRVTKNDQRFVYDGYLQVANERTVSNELVRQSFVWDPTESVATRPLAWFGSNAPPRLYTHDGNKNVSEVVAAASGFLAAHRLSLMPTRIPGVTQSSPPAASITVSRARRTAAGS